MGTGNGLRAPGDAHRRAGPPTTQDYTLTKATIHGMDYTRGGGDDELFVAAPATLFCDSNTANEEKRTAGPAAGRSPAPHNVAATILAHMD